MTSLADRLRASTFPRARCRRVECRRHALESDRRDRRRLRGPDRTAGFFPWLQFRRGPCRLHRAQRARGRRVACLAHVQLALGRTADAVVVDHRRNQRAARRCQPNNGAPAGSLFVLLGCLLIYALLRKLSASVPASLIGVALFLACPLVIRSNVMITADLPLAVLLFLAFFFCGAVSRKVRSASAAGPPSASCWRLPGC